MKILIVLFAPLLFIISYLTPKKKTIWVYGAWFGERYSDNSKDFFEFANSIEDKEIKHYWIYKNPLLKKTIELNGYNCVSAYSFRGILLQLRAKVFITSVNSSDFIPFLITPKNYFVQLWHGSPIKYIGLDSRNNKIRRTIDKLRFNTLDNYSLITSPSETIDKIYQSAFAISDTKIFRSGYPRNENLKVNPERKTFIRDYFGIENNEKMVAYLPTHRNEGKGLNPFRSVLNELITKNEGLNNKIKIIVKPHFYEKDSLNGIKESSNILIRYDFPFDLYEFLGATDMLITDYSSVIFDYELLNKKIIVFPFDFEEYTSKDRGLYYNFDFIYNHVHNIEKVETIDSLILALTKNNSCDENEEFGKSLFNVPFGGYSKLIYSKLIHDLNL
ncbi:CDP-glycerol glycerophosphotransferase family protein [Arenibacter sp. M-2]|uniref:CDP-glycerol glycerophosphotransferase family protein n=1 Tax=Arenibacter sp. M-2 TaxID=3053612 RepID=UPI00257076F6|nr:CDP-glycerol glycerophosphotransferase family protein [Arenibacter sp. M-2]MDL5510255.1 CDP-glycerol glycerophosphotransferase family protein [Arenibacter sp. M-2]